MDIELIEIREFMAALPPFDQLPEAVLDELPRKLLVRYLRRGTPFPPADADGDYLYIVRRGAIELRDAKERLLEKFAEGDLYASACLQNDAGQGYSGQTSEDTLFYLLPCSQLAKLRGQYPAFSEHFNQSIRERLRRALEEMRDSGIDNALLAIEVAELLSRRPVSVAPGTSIREAAALMTRERVSALLIMEDTRLIGMITDRDLRSRCLAEERDPSEPVDRIMTRKVHRIFRDTPAFEALLTMTRLNVHHLPVADRRGIIGVVSTSDLVRYQSANSVYLVGDVRKGESVETLAATASGLRELQIQLTNSGISTYHLGQSISAVADALTCRLNELAQAEFGPPPVPYVWLAVGSHARREQTVHSDQDSALLLADEYEPRLHGDYFESLARFVCDGLNSCGFAYCPGDVMASNPEWRQPYRIWRRYFENWTRYPEHQALMLASNFFDLRHVHGEESLYDRLRAEVLPMARDNRTFLAYLTANVVRNSPPLGFFRNFVLIREGDHAKTLDLKRRGVIPVVDLGRYYALSAGLPEVNTVERLKAAAEAGALSSEGASNLEDALEFLGTLRARHQARQLKRGGAPDNFLRPTELSPLERSQLKDVFTVVRTLQNAVDLSQQSERFS